MTIRQFEQTNQQECIAYVSGQYKGIYCNTWQIYYQIMKQLKQKLSPKRSYTEQEIWQEIYLVVDKDLSVQKKLVDQNFGLTALDFEQLKTQLQQGDKTLFHHIFLSRFKACEQYLMRKHGASRNDAYDIAIDAIIKFRQLIVADKIQYGNLHALLNTIAKHLYLDQIKRTKTKENVEGIYTENFSKPLDEATQERLDKALAKLCPPCVEILKQHYYNGISLKILATRIGKTEEAVRKQKQRCIEKLRNYLKIKKG